MNTLSSGGARKTKTHDLDEELVSANTQQRNWRGIFIALFVIIIVLSLIVTSVVVLTPPDEGPRIRGTRFKLQDILSHDFQAPRFNGTWVSENELVFRDCWGGISLFNADNLTSKSILNNHTFVQLNPSRFFLSPDQNFLLLACNVQKLFRYSFLAQYFIYDINTQEWFPLTVDPLSEDHPYLLIADWTPKRNGLILIYNYDIYYRPEPRSSKVYRITNSAIPGIVSNGVPDWLYEEEILNHNIAYWFSHDGRLLLYTTFNDSKVEELKFPWYGVHDGGNLYPEIRSLRYSKPATRNPEISLTVTDLADLNHITSRVLEPPQVLTKQGDFYFSSANWVSLTEVCVVWMNRPQNLSLVTVCRSPQWLCTETQRTSGEGKGWVETVSAPLFSPDGTRYISLAPVRDGKAGYFRHIIVVNIPKKRVLPLTHGKFMVNRILAWDHNRSLVYYLGTPEHYPAQAHLYSVSSEPPQVGAPLPPPTCLTCPIVNVTEEPQSDLNNKASPPKKKEKKTEEKPCTYYNAIFSPTLKYFVLECLGPCVPTTSLYLTRGSKLLTILQNNTRLKEKTSEIAGPQIKTFGLHISGGYQAQVRLFLPPGLREDEITRYPLVVHVYGAPGTQLVTDRWKVDWSWYLASAKDFIVAQIDGRGSAGQGYQLMHEIYHRLGTVEVVDQLEVTEYLRDSLPFIDKRRVAVWGWSYGGFVAALSLARDVSENGIFHCGISVAPVTSWTLYDSAYTERYMGLPNITHNYKGYQDADISNIAEKLKNKTFFLIHGTADDNVHLQQSMILAKKLAEKGVLFQQQIYADEKHALSGVKNHLYASMENFLDECFRKQVPPDIKAGLRNGGNDPF